MQDLKENIAAMKRIVEEITVMTTFESKNKSFIVKTVNSLLNQLSALNSSIPDLIGEDVPKPEQVERVPTFTGNVHVPRFKKKQFVEDLELSQKNVSKVLKKRKDIEGIQAPSGFIRLSNKIFGRLSSSMTESSLFKDIYKDMKKANFSFMLSSYVSLIFFVTLLVLIISLGAAILITQNDADLLRNILISLVLPIITFFVMLTYPSSVAGGNKKKIDSELPFAISQMSAISSSKVEPSKLFEIMAQLKEYPILTIEIKKVVNQINLYGYDLSTALKNVASRTSSQKVSELFNGIATIIKSGGNLTTYLREKSKDSLENYRFTREKYANTIGVYSDIYTALLIAAPLILMLVIAIMGVMGSSFLGMSIEALANLGIFLIAILNILFIIFLHFTQPEL
ncbi:MAG: type II secretion system F family protein [archaeon]